MKILVIEDDQPLLEGVTAVLQEEGYEIDFSVTGDEGLFMAKQNIYDAIILDIMLPEINGFEIVKEVRDASIKTPILLLTAKDSVEDRVKGLDVGADDYLIKPFAVPELLARIRVLLRDKGTIGEQNVSYGPIRLHIHEHDGYIDDHKLYLTIKEYELLEYFLRNKEQILIRDQIFSRIWGLDSDVGLGVVDVYVHHLRKKLSLFHDQSFIHTVRGVGFIFKGNDQNV
ncbi:response regulator transcription factor [Bacillus cereus]|uniref:response regulator transcription factor n=1 Tax=Bacillus cereus TaxID=1396 RepID=UPI002570B3E9|nr:response regulator transcription factor [Bacillus cereus]WJE23171.1 response regulator transcription factor [Bacillus cereus]